ncbi:DUF3102 domain-containing protein [Pelatocladus sp. BLCC-F211]|uniref:DUF3102 domain-containing protein n=1 Tax=Pelatocladus sp. BLCC-F211 TaxID=3342752 RepID=UPI0035B6C7FA
MGANDLPSFSKGQPSNPEEQNFNYTALETETRIFLQQYTRDIKSLIRRTSQDIIEIGEKLSEVKQQLRHGNFINWLKYEFNWSESTATRFMQVKAQFKSVNLTDLHISASALYLLAAPSTPQQARKEALERASLGEVISYSSACTIVNQYKKGSKAKTPKTVSFNDAPKDESFDVVQPVADECISVVEPSEDKLLGEKTKTPPYSQIVDQGPIMLPMTNNSDYPPNNQAQMEMELLFKIGHYLCITDIEQQNYKWLGKIAEVKKVTASDIDVVITISRQLASDDKTVENNSYCIAKTDVTLAGAI